ncbi:MAG TPA: PEP-CTERM sorting domain-containing protein [Phycisphaerae bacterium]|nr:PEP-CTERM sorting domain-containing protein [Phycisphaerae bacterium]
MNSRMIRILVCAGLALAFTVSTASATPNVSWMQMTPTPFGSAPPFSSTYTLPGVGTVQMTYTGPLSDFTEARLQAPLMQNGFVGPYSWTSQEALARTNWAYSGTLNSPWQVTYTFSSTIPGGTLILGVQGLGRRDPLPGENPLDCISTASVAQNGTYFGDWTGGGTYGATLFSGGAGNFTMMNSVSGAGGYDPWWNTGLAVVRIDDSVSSLTVHFNQTAGDGLGVNIGVLVPEPSAIALLALGGLASLRRRR